MADAFFQLTLPVSAAPDPTLLALDEPTNSISLDLLEAFAEAVLVVSGPVLVVSHTRAFSRQCGADTLALHGGALVLRDGGVASAGWSERVTPAPPLPFLPLPFPAPALPIGYLTYGRAPRGCQSSSVRLYYSLVMEEALLGRP
jgi:hypothetical protein